MSNIDKMYIPNVGLWSRYYQNVINGQSNAYVGHMKSGYNKGSQSGSLMIPISNKSHPIRTEKEKNFEVRLVSPSEQIVDQDKEEIKTYAALQPQEQVVPKENVAPVYALPPPPTPFSIEWETEDTKEDTIDDSPISLCEEVNKLRDRLYHLEAMLIAHMQELNKRNNDVVPLSQPQEQVVPKENVAPVYAPPPPQTPSTPLTIIYVNETPTTTPLLTITDPIWSKGNVIPVRVATKRREELHPH
ncbi:unnamed protein product [Mytilus edulis]|uniref:Uncharacterized protein n=1 Tax=Mytilus edulis TaxID=6550 RepID=A0A8S3RWB7_MYTED|nr:unnamed protein product [Mytilus edulis]